MVTLIFLEQRTLDGFTYAPGMHEMDEETAAQLLERFPAVIALGPVDDPGTGVIMEPQEVPRSRWAEETELVDTTATSSADQHPEDLPPPLWEATEAAIALAQEHGLDLATVVGTGSGGRITKGDVENALRLREAATEDHPEESVEAHTNVGQQGADAEMAEGRPTAVGTEAEQTDGKPEGVP